MVCNEHKGYHYIEIEGSITHSYRKAFFHDINILYDTLKKITQQVNTAEIQTAISYNYIFLFYTGIMQEIGRANKVGYIQKYKSISACCADIRFKESIRQIDIERLPKKMKANLKLLSKNKVCMYMLNHIASALIRRIF